MGTHPIFESDFDCLTESMDHVQQILLKQLSGQPTNAGSTDSGQVDWAAKAKQWAEEQKRAEERRKRETLIKEQQEQQAQQSGSLQGWKNEHPSWRKNDPIPPPPPQLSHQQQPQQQTYQVKQPQNQGFNNESFNVRFAQYQQQKRQQHQQQRLPQHHRQHHHQQQHQQQERRKSFQGKKVIEKNEIETAKQNRNLPKWMLDEIERLQAKQSAGEDLEEGDEKHLSELQQLADQDDSEGESSDDDWKTEGRKISEELTRANEQSSGEETEGDTIEPLTTEDIERVKNQVLAATMKQIFLKVTDDLTGKICQKFHAKVARENEPTSSGLGGLIGYADSDSDKEDDQNETSDNGDLTDSDNETDDSVELRARRKKFEKKQKRRLKLLRLKRGSDDELSDDSDSSQNSSDSRSRHHKSRRSRSRSKHRNNRSRSRERDRHRHRRRSRERSRRKRSTSKRRR